MCSQQVQGSSRPWQRPAGPGRQRGAVCQHSSPIPVSSHSERTNRFNVALISSSGLMFAIKESAGFGARSGTAG